MDFGAIILEFGQKFPIVNTAVFCTALVALPFYLLIEGVFIIGPAIKRSLRF